MATNKSFLGKGWRFPVDVDRTGGVSMSQLEENVRQSIFIILGTAPGERIMRPDFGCDIHDLMFAPNNAITAASPRTTARKRSTSASRASPKVTAKARPAPDEPNKILIDIEYVASPTTTTVTSCIRSI